MSSLWSLIRKHREIRYDPKVIPTSEVDLIFRVVVESQPHLVNISEQANEYYRPHDPDFFTTLDATPCFSCLWMEWTWTDRHGVLINRFPATQELANIIRLSGKKMTPPFSGSKYLLQLFFFSEHEGYAQFHGILGFYIDAMGHPIEGVEVNAAEYDKKPIESIGLMVADVLTTMNTKGTRIEPPFSEQHAQIVKPDRPPFSVWHTIHLPKFARPPLDGATVSPEILERREHWVRGHRRDYRNGSGMFGRVKALVWVPEFQRGNPELGTVKQSYVVREDHS